MRMFFDTIETPETAVLVICALITCGVEYWLWAPL
jgi:hypothetical protein